MSKKPLSTKYFKLSIELESQFSNILRDNHVHFRGNLNSLSLISVSDKKPELGVACTEHLEWTEEIIWIYINKIKAKSIPQRPTPEKSLQAWIIRKSLENNHLLPFDESIRFITSELAITDETRGKVVSDIIGFDLKANRIVILELKSKRQLSRLIQQVENFESIINKNKSFFDELLCLHGLQVKEGPLKAVIWPRPIKFSLSNLTERNITEYCYLEGNDDFKITKVN